MVDIPGLSAESLLRESPSRQSAGQGEVLQVDYGGPFKDCKDELVRGFEREYLTRLLSRSKGNVAKAARDAGLDRKHLYSLLHKYNLVQGSGDGPGQGPKPPSSAVDEKLP
jgi:DNA-binding NtrC family response regulator